MDEERHGSWQMIYICEYWTQQEIRGSHFQELFNTHLMDVLDFPWGAELHRRRRYPGTKCWCIAVDTLSTLGSLFSSIPPYRVARDSGT